MKKIALIFALGFIFSLSAYGQCVEKPNDPCLSVSQSTIDRAAKAVDELVAARDALTKYAAERVVTDAERKSAAALIDGLNQLVATGLRIQDEQNKVIALYKQVIEMQQGIIEKMERMLNKPKTGWEKFTALLSKIALVLTGVALGGL